MYVLIHFAPPGIRLSCQVTKILINQRFPRRQQELGFTKEQSEGFAQLQRELIDERLATKSDIVAAKNELQQQIKELEYHLTIRLGGMMAASIAIVAALVKLS